MRHPVAPPFGKPVSTVENLPPKPGELGTDSGGPQFAQRPCAAGDTVILLKSPDGGFRVEEVKIVGHGKAHLSELKLRGLPILERCSNARIHKAEFVEMSFFAALNQRFR